MPNWCENCLTFMSNGTPEGGIALRDFHDRIIKAYAYRAYNNGDKNMWECDIEDYSYDQCNGLFQYQDKLPVHKRGYITHITDINFDCFHMISYDAWAANNAYWVLLLNRLYGNLITFTYQASEPGMGLYYTNDMGLLPRYNVGIYTNGLENLMNIPAAFNTNDNLFMCLNTQNPYIGNYGRNDYKNNWSKPSQYDFDFHMIVEGNDDEVISKCEDYVFGKEMPNISKINDIKQQLPDNVDVDIDEFDYVPLEDEVSQAICQDVAATLMLKNTNNSLNGEVSMKNIIEETNKNLEKFSNELGVDKIEFKQFKEEL